MNGLAPAGGLGPAREQVGEAGGQAAVRHDGDAGGLGLGIEAVRVLRVERHVDVVAAGGYGRLGGREPQGGRQGADGHVVLAHEFGQRLGVGKIGGHGLDARDGDLLNVGHGDVMILRQVLRDYPALPSTARNENPGHVTFPQSARLERGPEGSCVSQLSVHEREHRNLGRDTVSRPKAA